MSLTIVEAFSMKLEYLSKVFVLFNVIPSCEETSFNHLLWSVFQSSYYTVTFYKFMVDLCVQLPQTALYS